MMERVIFKNRIYQHFKGKYYYVIDICEHSETGEKMVYYKAIYDKGKTYVRPLEMFASPVDKEAYPHCQFNFRFTLVDGRM